MLIFLLFDFFAAFFVLVFYFYFLVRLADWLIILWRSRFDPGRFFFLFSLSLGTWPLGYAFYYLQGTTYLTFFTSNDGASYYLKLYHVS